MAYLSHMLSRAPKDHHPTILTEPASPAVSRGFPASRYTSGACCATTCCGQYHLNQFHRDPGISGVGPFAQSPAFCCSDQGPALTWSRPGNIVIHCLSLVLRMEVICLFGRGVRPLVYESAHTAHTNGDTHTHTHAHVHTPMLYQACTGLQNCYC